MPQPLSLAATLEKNKLAAAGAWITLLDITLPDATHIRVCDNDSDVTWPTVGGETWAAFPFQLDALTYSGRGELPTLVCRVSNVTRAIQGYLEQASGGIGSTVRLLIVHSEHLDLAAAEIDETFDVTAAVADVHWVTFTLGAPNPLLTRFPRHTFSRDHCRWIYKSSECGYGGSLATCNRNLSDCRAHNNSLRFGGFPGIPGGSLYRV